MAINKNKLMDAARKARDKGQVDKAIKEYLKIVKEDPKDVRVWLKIGDLYAKKGEKNEATGMTPISCSGPGAFSSAVR